jgi:hypothetical protein
MAGFDNRQLTGLVGTLLDEPYTSRQATYDLRRLRRKELIERLPHSNRYRLTPLGRRVAVLFTKAHGRILTPGLAWLDSHLPAGVAARSPLASAWRQLERPSTGLSPTSWWPPKRDLLVNFVTSKSN